MKIHEDIEQGSPEWYALRAGRPTASCFSKIITPAKGDLSKSADAYAAELLAEQTQLGLIEAEDEDFRGSPDLERGKQMEPKARDFFAFEHGADVRSVGFCESDCGRYGMSPDGLLDDDRILELKCPRVKTHIKWLISGELPLEHKCQCHGEILVSGKDHGFFMSYVDTDEVPPLIVKVERDEFTDKMEESIKAFCDRLDALRGEVLA